MTPRFVPVNRLQAGQILSSASKADLALYDTYWSQIVKSSSESTEDGATEKVDAEKVGRFLASEAHPSAVNRLLAHCSSDEKGIEKDEFMSIVHILHSAIATAQDLLFQDDELWADAPPASKPLAGASRNLGSNHGNTVNGQGKERAPNDWVIGVVAAARGITEDEKVIPKSPGSPKSTSTATSIEGCHTDTRHPEVTSTLWGAFNDEETFSRLCTVSNNQLIDGRFETDDSVATLLQPVPGTNLLPMKPSERVHCEEGFRAKGYEAGGGLKKEDAAKIAINKMGLSSDTFDSIWRLCSLSSSSEAPLDIRQFCLFVHLCRCARNHPGGTLPATLTPVQVTHLLEGWRGLFPADVSRMNSSREINGSPLQMSRLGDVLRAGTSVKSVVNAIESIPSRPESDSESDGNESTISSNLYLGKAATIPGLPVPNPGSMSRLERAVWKEQAGDGHQGLEIWVQSAVLMQKKQLDRPFITLSVRDQLGRLVELPLDSHPGILHENSIEFDNQRMRLATPLKSLPPGCMVFMEIRQWKAAKKKFSTVAWSFVQTEMMVDSGPVCNRVRCGPVVLPLFKKPVDTSLQRLKRLNGQGPALHILVSGVSEEVGSG